MSHYLLIYQKYYITLSLSLSLSLSEIKLSSVFTLEIEPVGELVRHLGTVRILRAISALCARALHITYYTYKRSPMYVFMLTSGTCYPLRGSSAQNLRCIIRTQAHLRTIPKGLGRATHSRVPT